MSATTLYSTGDRYSTWPIEQEEKTCQQKLQWVTISNTRICFGLLIAHALALLQQTHKCLYIFIFVTIYKNEKSLRLEPKTWRSFTGHIQQLTAISENLHSAWWLFLTCLSSSANRTLSLPSWYVERGSFRASCPANITFCKYSHCSLLICQLEGEKEIK